MRKTCDQNHDPEGICPRCVITPNSVFDGIIAANQKARLTGIRVEDAGRKDDVMKLRYDLIPAYPLERLAEVYTIGAKKYDDRNWEKGIAYSRIFGALQRHAWAFWRGEQRDGTDGQHHLASVAWCAFALMEYERTHPEKDDRPLTQELKDSGSPIRI